MSVGDTLGTPIGILIAIGILDGVERALDEGIDILHWDVIAMTETDVDNKQRSGTEILTQLQILIEAQAIGGPIAPVLVKMTGTLLYRTDGLLPLKGIVVGCLSLDIAATGETEECRLGIVKKLGKVRTETVSTTFPRVREERDKA